MANAPSVLILGAGYAGLNAALRLNDHRRARSPAFELTLLDQHPYHLVKIRLHEAAARDAAVSIPLPGLFDGDGPVFHQAAVTGLDFGQRRVDTTTGSLSYDYLLLALGSTTNFFNIPGMAEHAFALDSLADAVRLRGRVESQVVLAANATDPAERERLLRFVVGGAGYTGIELAGELADVLPELCQQVGLERNAADVVVVDGHPRILPVLDEDSAAYAAGELEKKGVHFRTSVKVTAVDADGVTLDPGGKLLAATVIWAGGIRANPLTSGAGAQTGQQGRLLVDGSLRVVDHPEVFAIGDCGVAMDPTSQQPVPATAQLALQEGGQAAENIICALDGREATPFDPSERGEIVSIGHDRAVGWLKALADRQVKLRGLVGGLAKRAGEAEWEIHLWRETHHLDDLFG